MRINQDDVFQSVEELKKQYNNKVDFRLQGQNGYWNLYQKEKEGGYWEIEGGLNLREMFLYVKALRWAVYNLITKPKKERKEKRKEKQE
jgi:hypothetical protein